MRKRSRLISLKDQYRKELGVCDADAFGEGTGGRAEQAQEMTDTKVSSELTPLLVEERNQGKNKLVILYLSQGKSCWSRGTRPLSCRWKGAFSKRMIAIMAAKPRTAIST